MGELREKTVVLTGASEGIGLATAHLLAQRGANVVLASRSREKLGEVVEALAAFPGERIAVATDLAQPEAREALIAKSMEQFGRIDVLVNNAGVGLDACLEESGDEESRYLFEVNFFAPLHLTRLVLPIMRAQGGGQIVQVSSIVGMRATPHLAIYCATKYALNGLSDALRTEVTGANIQITTIYPGVTATRFLSNQLRAQRTRPHARAVAPERVASVITSSIERRSRARYVTWSDFLLVNLARLLPSLAEWALATGFRLRRGTLGVIESRE